MMNRLKRLVVSFGNPPLAIQATLGASLLCAISCLVLWWVYTKGCNAFYQEAAYGLTRSAESASALVDGELHKKLTRPEQEDSDDYRKAIAPLARVLKSSKEFRNIYTAVLIDDRIHFILDPTPPGDADGDGVNDHVFLMEEYAEKPPGMMRALKEHVVSAEFATVTDKWGTFISGYAPIRDSAGNAVGIIGIDIEAESFLARYRALRSQTMLGIFIAIIISAVAGVVGYRILRHRRNSEMERRKSEEMLRLSEAKYRTIIDNMLDIVCVYLPDGTITYASANLQRWGIDPASTIGANVLDFIAEEGRESGKKLLEKIVAERLEATYCIILQTPSGKRINAEIANKIVLDLEGNIQQITGIVRDITERKLLEDRLRQAEKMEAIGRLAGGIAHDFNNQLTGILGYAELLAMEASTAESKKFCDRICSAAMRASDLTRNLLAFSRKGNSLSVNFDVNNSIAETIGLLERSLDKRIEIQYRKSKTPAIVNGDPTQIQNAILNLAINARDAMPQGGVLTFSVEMAELDTSACQASELEIEPGTYALVSVADTGVGMPEEIQKRIFEPFFTTKEKGKGTGLGLAAVYGSAKEHKGTIAVVSAPGKGTTFKLYLPLSRQKIAPEKAEYVAAAPEDGLCIMMVDDEPAARQAAGDLLKKLGYGVAEFENPIAAINHYEANWQSIDLVILDLVMPNMSGRESFMALRAINPDAMIIIVTGFDMDEDARNLLNDGAKAVLHKPFKIGEFSATISGLIDTARLDKCKPFAG